MIFKSQPGWELQGFSSTASTECGQPVTVLAGTTVISEEETNKMIDALLAKSLSAGKEEKPENRLEEKTLLALFFVFLGRSFTIET